MRKEESSGASEDERSTIARRPRSPIGEHGVDIVGTDHSEFRPGQDVIYPKLVDLYADRLRAGDPVAPPTFIEDPTGGPTRILADGHHRYVASRRTGLPLAPVEESNPLTKEFIDTSYPDWRETRYGPYEDEALDRGAAE